MSLLSTLTMLRNIAPTCTTSMAHGRGSFLGLSSRIATVVSTSLAGRCARAPISTHGPRRRCFSSSAAACVVSRLPVTLLPYVKGAFETIPANIPAPFPLSDVSDITEKQVKNYSFSSNEIALRVFHQRSASLFPHLSDVVKASDTDEVALKAMRTAGMAWGIRKDGAKSYRPASFVLAYPTDSPDNHLEAAPTLDTTSVPLILLDVDGVLNSRFRSKDPHPGDYTTSSVCSYVQTGSVRLHRAASFDITWSPSVVERVNAWSDRAEVQWLTTWEHWARTSLSPVLGLRSFKTADFWKRNTLAGTLTASEQARPIVWIDDELLHRRCEFTGELREDMEATYHEQVQQMRDRCGPLFLPIGTGLHMRLMPEYLDRVDAFLDEHDKTATAAGQQK